MKPYEIIGKNHRGQMNIHLTSGEYSGIIYNYGGVELIEEEDHLRVKFDFELIRDEEGKAKDATFKDYIGDILTEMIFEGLIDNSLIYTGGVDENRTKDSEQSDS